MLLWYILTVLIYLFVFLINLFIYLFIVNFFIYLCVIMKCTFHSLFTQEFLLKWFIKLISVLFSFFSFVIYSYCSFFIFVGLLIYLLISEVI